MKRMEISFINYWIKVKISGVFEKEPDIESFICIFGGVFLTVLR